MKKLFFIAGLFISLTVFSQNWYDKSTASSLNAADLFLLRQSGTTKNIPYSVIADRLNDTANIVRAELPPLWRTDIADTADVLRIEIANASTTDTAWTRLNESVILKFINDSVGIGTTTPTSKLDVNGEIKGLSLFLDDGQDNIKIGEDAGAALGITDLSNIFIGKSAGLGANGNAEANIGIGVFSLRSLTTGLNDIGIGGAAGFSTTNGNFNIFIGTTSGFSNTTGNNNVFVGHETGENASTSSSENVFIGSGAGNDADIDDGVFIGFNAGNVYDQAGGVIVGHEAGDAATSSVGLTAVGNSAAGALITSDFHTAVGFEALDALQTNDGSTVVGYQAGGAATGAAGFSAFGYQAGLSTTTGDDNSFFGSISGLLNTTGSANSFFGKEAGASNISGSANALFGRESGKNLTGGNNTFLGYRTGLNSVAVDGCVLVGNQAGTNNTVSNVLYIDNTSTASPLIWGDFANDRIVISGNASDNPNDRTFYVNGSAGGDGAWNNDSDRKLKKNIEPINNALSKVMNLQGVEFDWKDNRRARSIGFIANDVAKVVPEVVDVGETFSMQTSQLTALLVEGMKTQQRQIRLLYALIGFLGIFVVILLFRKTLRDG